MQAVRGITGLTRPRVRAGDVAAGASDPGAQHFRHVLQRPVACGMAFRIVDALEVIETQHRRDEQSAVPQRLGAAAREFLLDSISGR